MYDDHKRGEPFHNWLTDRSNGVAWFMQEGHTVKQYPLVVAHGMPFLLNCPGKGHVSLLQIFIYFNILL